VFTSTCEIDPRSLQEFSAALDQYADYRHEKHGKSYDYALNRSAKDVAAWAAHYTIRADKGALKTLLGDPAVAARILSARFTKAGKKRPSGRAWATTLAYYRSHTPKTSAFMASGWLPAFRTLRAFAKESSGVNPRTAFGRGDEVIPTKHSYGPLGEAIPAHDVGDGLAVEIANLSVNPRNPTSWSAGLGKHGPTALDLALQTKAADMMGYLEAVQESKARTFNKEG
jgi:hypothetical protein